MRSPYAHVKYPDLMNDVQRLVEETVGCGVYDGGSGKEKIQVVGEENLKQRETPRYLLVVSSRQNRSEDEKEFLEARSHGELTTLKWNLISKFTGGIIDIKESELGPR